MATAKVFNPTLTEAGQAAAFNAKATGLEIAITHVSFGTGSFIPTGKETALLNEQKKVTIAGGTRITDTQIRISSVWRSDVGTYAVTEVAFWAGDTLFAVWSNAGEVLGYKTPGVDFVLFNDISLAQVPSGSVTVQIDPDQSVALAALSAHEGADNAHPQYVRYDVFIDAQVNLWAKTVAGTANAIALTMQDGVKVAAYKAGQRFIFKAAASNSGAVTAAVNGLAAVNVYKNGNQNLLANEVKAGAVYELIYDGSAFQIVGGVGGGGTISIFENVASAGQTSFDGTYTPGSLKVYYNGRLLSRSDYRAEDGSTVVLTKGANAGDVILIEAQSVFSLPDFFTKAEMMARGLMVSRSPYAGDCNAMIEQGTFRLDAATVNGPPGVSLQGAILDVKPWDVNTILQLIYYPAKSQVWYRRAASTSVSGNSNGALNGPWEPLANLNSPAFTGEPTAPTPEQFDNSLKLVTTEFLRRAAGNYRDWASLPGNTTLTQDQVGKPILVPSGSTITLPACAGLPSGATLLLQCNGASAATIVVQGSDVIRTGQYTESLTSISMGPGDTLTLVSNGSNYWWPAGGSARLPYSDAFKSRTRGIAASISSTGTPTASAAFTWRKSYPSFVAPCDGYVIAMSTINIGNGTNPAPVTNSAAITGSSSGTSSSSDGCTNGMNNTATLKVAKGETVSVVCQAYGTATSVTWMSMTHNTHYVFIPTNAG
ncbi:MULTISPECIES: phage tail protein [Pseudomonas]|uniref:Phage tail fibre protein N-terminal domain-containing protein n=1 Tax=Pseudomonas lutea TaxID=243924 RepID=A0A9X8QLP8_9PSED|nr:MULTISPECIES: phage tail protein [Pseudomonas]SER35917.1 hypothetical protein SAMN05216409_11830 [Pseudomonas lutea]